MTIKVLVNGAFGRMGQMTSQTISDHLSLELVGQTGREFDLKKAILDSKAEVVIDFTVPNAVFANCMAIIESGAHPVIGTSGLTLAQIQELKAHCQRLKLGAIIAPNFSLGAVLMMKYAQAIVKYMPQVEIIEMHHEGKVDSPSGTALRSAEMLANADNEPNKTSQTTHETIPHARGANYHNIAIHSIRLPGILAQQQIIFGAKGETLTLQHNSIDRQCFMPGICLACEKVIKLDGLVYGLEELL